MQASEQLGINIAIVNHLDEADILMTLRPYYRARQSVILDAEERGIPIYVLRSNTTTQIEYTLGNLVSR